METIMKNCKGKEQITRKRVSSFIEKLLRFSGYDFRHDLYKEIIYAETEYRTPLEEKIKNYYDAYLYLLSNHKNPFSQEMVRKFFYLLQGKEKDWPFLLRITTKFFHLSSLPELEQAIDFHLYLYQELNDLIEEERLIISLMMMNYVLVRNGIPTIQILRTDLTRYIKFREDYFNKDKMKMYFFMIEILKKSKFQDKSYYKNLQELSSKEIYQVIYEDKEELKEKYGIKSIYLYGSYAKGNQRIDSDIDLIIAFSLDLSYEEKLRNIEALSNKYFNIFHRYIDFTEINEYLNDEFIKEVTKVKKIY